MPKSLETEDGHLAYTGWNLTLQAFVNHLDLLYVPVFCDSSDKSIQNCEYDSI